MTPAVLSRSEVARRARLDPNFLDVAAVAQERGLLTITDAPETPTFNAWLKTVTPEWNWDYKYAVHIQEHLARVTAGSLRRLMIFCPPQHGKSELTTIRYPIYRMDLDNSFRVAVACYNEDFASGFGRSARAIAAERIRLSTDRSAAIEWQTKAGGRYQACGTNAPPTGKGFSLILIDDPVRSREEADSAAYRDKVWLWYRDGLRTRQAPGCAFVLIMTRWHEDDLAGRILMQPGGNDWEVIRLPAFAETQEERDAWARKYRRQEGLPEPLGREPGEPLCPERYDRAFLEDQREVMQGGFYAQYQQDPQSASGGLFKRECFKIVDSAPSNLQWVRFWDTAAKVGQKNDYTVGALVGKSPDNQWYVRDVVRGRWEYPEAKQQVLETGNRDGEGVPIAIEDTSSGTAIQQDLRRDPAASGLLIKPQRVAYDKGVRAALWANYVEAGQFHLVNGPWVHDFLNEVVTFPLGAHDDQVDAISGATAYLSAKREWMFY